MESALKFSDYSAFAAESAVLFAFIPALCPLLENTWYGRCECACRSRVGHVLGAMNAGKAKSAR